MQDFTYRNVVISQSEVHKEDLFYMTVQIKAHVIAFPPTSSRNKPTKLKFTFCDSRTRRNRAGLAQKIIKNCKLRMEKAFIWSLW